MHLHPRAPTATWTGSAGAHWIERAPAVIGERLGAYAVRGLLGEGGMARVYLAEHTVIERRVAIKRLLPSLARFPEAHELFLREARITASVRHANLIDVYDFGRDAGGRPYFVMELAPGETLACRVARGPMLASQALDVAIALSDAVAAIHHAGYLHRDIKCDNILLGRDGRRLVPKLVDFGIARALDPDGTVTVEGMVGTPRTMAPEQIAQERIDVTADVWSLGVVLYEMLTGRAPFGDDLLAIVSEPPDPLPAHIDPAIAEVVDACLCKEPSGRPPGAAALERWLREVQEDYLGRRGMVDRDSPT